MKAIRKDDRIALSFPPRDLLLDAVKALPDRKYMSYPSPHWTVPASPFHAVLAKRVLEPLGWEFDDSVNDLAAFWTRPVELDLPEGMWQFQKEGADFIERCGGRALVGDDPGTGKTITVLGWCYAKRHVLNRIIVVCPTNVTFKWARDTKKWLGYDAQVVTTSKQLIPRDVPVIIMSYDMLRRRLDDVYDINWDLLIMDEFHATKNTKAQRSRAVKGLARRIDYVIGASGTPFHNRHLEFFNPLNITDPTAFPDWWYYANRYTMGKQYMWKGVLNREELVERLSYSMIRRTKQEVLGELPDIQRAIVPLELGRSAKKYYREVESEALDLDSPLPAMSMLRQAVGALKRDITVDWANDFLSSTDEKLVIYAHHLDNVGHVAGQLTDWGVFVITGSVAPKERDNRWMAFQEKRLPRVMVIDSAAKEGIDLYKASNIWFMEREFVPAWEEQAESRLHRAGQKNAVTAWYPIVQGTMDTYLEDMIQKKRTHIKKLLQVDNVDEITVERDGMRQVFEAMKKGESYGKG